MEQMTLHVQGMSCGHCVNSIESNVSDLTGVAAVKVNLAEGTVDIQFDQKAVSLDAIKLEIEEQGYEVA